MTQRTLILASASPRRKELLARFALPFVVEPSRYKEISDPSLEPEKQALSIARGKAFEVATRMQGLIIAADTLVVLDGEIMGKPHSEEEALRMLRRLSGAKHHVYTALVIYDSCQEHSVEAVERTAVWFRTLDETEMQRYTKSGEYLDKAGGYAVQGLAAAFIERIEGCYYNVVGLPLYRLDQLLRKFEFALI